MTSFPLADDFASRMSLSRNFFFLMIIFSGLEPLSTNAKLSGRFLARASPSASSGSGIGFGIDL